ncbi:MAG: DNA primase [Geminicoccaceae bacterium]
MDLADFKARLPILDIVGGYVKLQRAGSFWRGRCPFHQEKTPSFTVTEARGTYHCFGCNEHGNAIDFLMGVENLDFVEAVKRAAELSGLPEPLAQKSPETERAKELKDALAEAASWFARNLRSDGGGGARAYLDGRGINETSIEVFRLGYAGDGRDTLSRHLTKQGFSDDQLVDAGISGRSEHDSSLYDRFRDRLIFPIADPQGRVVGFGGRTLGEAKAKYLNSPEGPAFRKRELLYGADLAKAARRSGKPVIMVEGYTDVIALHQAELGHGVAPLGTAVSAEQLKLLWRFADNPVICLDGDAAGVRAAARTAEIALETIQAGRMLGFAVLEAGDDPDSLIRAGKGEELSRRLSDAMPLERFLWEAISREARVGGADQRAVLNRRVRELKGSIRDEDVRRAYGDAWYFRLRNLSGRPQKQVSPLRQKSDLRPRQTGAAEVLNPLLARPLLIERFAEELSAIRFEDPTLDSFLAVLLDWYARGNTLETSSIIDHLTRQGFDGVIETLKHYPTISAHSDETAEIARYAMILEVRARHATRHRVRSSLSERAIDASADEVEREVAAADRVMNQIDG